MLKSRLQIWFLKPDLFGIGLKAHGVLRMHKAALQTL